jgi:two-component system, OmpR family, phosphate regulon response regulator PhoB
MASILVIEDEKDLLKVLEYNLRLAGHQVLSASLGKAGLRLAREQRPDLVLLDLMLPDLQGTEICRSLRNAPETEGIRIVMLTARGEEIDRVLGLELGADDYVVKPFSLRELMLRIQAVLRRGHAEAAPAGQVAFGLLRFDREAHRVWAGTEEVDLTALEFRLLLALHDRRNRVLSREKLLREVWGIDADITTRTVDTHVKRLREKLGQAGRYVETVRGVGYRFAEAPGDEGN